MTDSGTTRWPVRSRGPDIDGRPFCYRCWRPEPLCLCPHIRVVENPVEVVYLQHPNERTMPFNTARLAHLSLAKSRLIRGIRFDDEPIRHELHARRDRVGILFPSPRAKDLSQAPADLETLVVVDGTWNEARKILLHSPSLLDLPCYAFVPDKPSNYRIRKEPKESYISTIEATVFALRIVDRDPAKYQELLALFDRMVDRQIDFTAINRLQTGPVANRADSRNLRYLEQILFSLAYEERLETLARFTDAQRTGLENLALELFGVPDVFAKELRRTLPRERAAG